MKNHFIIFLLLFLSLISNNFIFSQSDSSRENLEALPIISYDSDIGFGYGGKLFLFDLLETEESFDLILFNSTKGEQWYKFVYSIPDFESRQGTIFPFSLDLMIEYDKFNKYISYHSSNYVYTQSGTPDLTLSKYDCIFEKTTIGVFLSRGFSKDFTSTLAILYKSFNLFNLTPVSSSSPKVPFDLRGGAERYLSSFINFKVDTRNSYINPTSGITMLLELEHAYKSNSKRLAFLRGLISLCYYKEILSKDLILALRASKERIYAFDKPAHFKSIPIGGNNTVRGIPMDKYRFDDLLLVNCEMRFPMWWKFGGIVGVDLANGGNYYSGYHGWLSSTVAGLRFYMDNFIVRADIGFSKEGTGVYLNFGHLF